MEPSAKFRPRDINLNCAVSDNREATDYLEMPDSGASTSIQSGWDVIAKQEGLALLELGMGFHADFTGRQNAVMAGQLLGMSVEEISKLMPEIEAFAEIGEYMDQPLRVYSSGMQMRVAFSVATARRPDVLIVDEALSVGDASFQHKSYGRIKKFREEGTTLLIVSHDPQAIKAICDRAVLIENGRIVQDGKPDSVLEIYNAYLIKGKRLPVQNTTTTKHGGFVSGGGGASVSNISMHNSNGADSEIFHTGERVRMVVGVRVIADIPRLTLGYLIRDRLGADVYGTNTNLTGQVLLNCQAGSSFEFEISFSLNLGAGNYSISTALVDTTDTEVIDNFEWKERVKMFSVVSDVKPQFIGIAWLNPVVTISRK